MANTALCYGVSGSGKTTLAVFMAMWMYETYGLTTRLISADLGGWKPVELSGLTKAGIVSTFNMSNRVRLLSDWRKLGKGHWPRQVEEGGKKVWRLLPDEGAIRKVGLYFIENLTSISDSFLRYIPQQSEVEFVNGFEKVKDIGPQGATGRYEEEGEIFAGNSQGHYNVVQVEMYNLMTMFSCLPIKQTFWTGHQGTGGKGEEDKIAPQLAGEKKNCKVPSWVGDCFHLDVVPELLNAEGQIEQKMEIRAYFTPHTNASGLTALCKPRTSPEGLPALQERFPGGYVPLGLKQGENIDAYFKWQIEQQKKEEGTMKTWKDRIDAQRINRT